MENMQRRQMATVARRTDIPHLQGSTFPFPDILALNGISAGDVRVALDGGDGFHVWVGRKTGQLCLLITDAAKTNSAASCFDRDRFAAGGAHLGMDGRKADWYGLEVTLNPPGPSASNNSVPFVPAPGPGNVDAANGWFAAPATASDAFPDEGMLTSLGVTQADVRLVNLEGNHYLWVMKQGAKGFCMATAEDMSSQSVCKTIKEFEESGLALSERGFAASWNGESFSSSQ